MKMIDTETGHEMVEVSGHDKKEYASKGVAGTGLGLGIAGTALWLLSSGLGGCLFGNRAGLAGAAAIGAEGIAKKEDKCELINGMWTLAFNGQTARFNDRQTINAEMFGLYEKWFPNATNNEIEDKIVEATISNWFEDEDASSDKVWEYFRVI